MLGHPRMVLSSWLIRRRGHVVRCRSFMPWSIRASIVVGGPTPKLSHGHSLHSNRDGQRMVHRSRSRAAGAENTITKL